jgi:hypothetical protein
LPDSLKAKDHFVVQGYNVCSILMGAKGTCQLGEMGAMAIPCDWKKGTYVRFEVFTAVTMKNCVFWDITPCDSCKNRRFGGTYASIMKVTRIGELGTTLAVTSN